MNECQKEITIEEPKLREASDFGGATINKYIIYYLLHTIVYFHGNNFKMNKS